MPATALQRIQQNAADLAELIRAANLPPATAAQLTDRAQLIQRDSASLALFNTPARGHA